MGEILLTGLITFLTTGGLGGILFWNFNKKLKELEVKKEEVSTVESTINLWKNLYETVKMENEELKNKAIEREGKIMDLRDELDKAFDKYHESQLDSEKKERLIQDLTFKKCTRNNCPYRKPPRELGEEELPPDADFSFINDGK